MNLLLLLIPLLAAPCFADSVRAYGEWGIAFDHPGAKSYSDVKFAEFGASGDRGKLAFKTGIGGWTDITGYKNQGFTASNGFYAQALFGVEPKSEHFYMHYLLGPALISNMDALLGSPVQVSHEFGFGMRDARDVRIGVVIKHFSDAGLSSINYGRNFAGMEMQF